MKIPVVLLSLVAAVSARTTLRRLMSDNTDMMPSASSLGGLDDDDDYTCTFSFPPEAEFCHELRDGKGDPCVWCPVGELGGVCLSNHQAEAINGAQVPHVTCGKHDDPSEADVDFWDMVVKCNVGGDTEKDCVETAATTGSCTWCKIEQKSAAMGIGLCLSTEFYHALRDQDDGVLSELMQCTTDSTDTLLRAGSLTDMTCILEGNPEQDDTVWAREPASLCGKTLDAEGRPCQLFTILVDFCMTEIQVGLLNLLLEMGFFEPLNKLDDDGVASDFLGDFTYQKRIGKDNDDGAHGTSAVYKEEEGEEPATAVTTTITTPKSQVPGYPEVDNKEPSSASELLAKYVQHEEVKDELDSETGN